MDSDEVHQTPLPLKQQPSNIKFLFYQPGQPEQPFSPPDRQPTVARWEKLADRIGLATGVLERVDGQSLLSTFPRCDTDTALQAASRLASSVSPNERDLHAIVLTSLCTVLEMSGRASPEELDGIVKTIVQSSLPRYLDKIKRGARVANEIIAAWAEHHTTGDLVSRLDQATQAVLQARLSMSQWGVLSECGSKVKERILSYPLPDIPARDGRPLVVPLLIDAITNGSINMPEICRALGYKGELTSCICTIPRVDIVQLDVPGTEQVSDVN
ncbi:hypothetical protein VM1G_11312 [Cytospora mali]|uniref:Uncharacterized protein n=1 Tax=Cytospora mali TaxID=578113 RepID=A0A194VNC4_CYTMA|nr:hypothetical protein VM1G_11312 [Valsa mali]